MNRHLGIFLFLIGFITPIIMVVKSIQFNQDCGGYLKQAADANSVELAIERLDIAIDYAEKNNLTNGYTSVLWKTEDDNVGFWYKNLKTCRDELSSCLESSQFEKTNVLMKVRESLTDDSGENGTTITLPGGISRYPNNLLFGVFSWISLFLIIIGSYFTLEY